MALDRRRLAGARGRRHRLPGLLRPGHAGGAARRRARLELHTHHLVREDQQALYGFRTTEELGFFELLTTVSGVGPKVGLAIVSSRPVADLQLAILQGDEAVLTAVSAASARGWPRRIILELQREGRRGGAVGRRGRGTPGGGGVASRRSSPRSRRSATPRREAREAARGAAVAGCRPTPRSRTASRPRCASCAATETRRPPVIEHLFHRVGPARLGADG